jgi:hypothetical protein
MALNQLQVGPQGPFSPGTIATAAGGLEAELLSAQLHPAYYEAARRGRLFIQTTVPAGVAIPISTTTSPLMVIWNPSGSGRNVVLMRLSIGYVSGTTVAGAVGLSYTTGAGANVATGAAFTAFNQVNPTNGFVGAGQQSAIKTSSAATNTLGAAGTWFYTIFQNLAVTSATTVASNECTHDFAGSIIVPPGVAVWLTASAASSALYSQTWTWEEIAERLI